MIYFQVMSHDCLPISGKSKLPGVSVQHSYRCSAVVGVRRTSYYASGNVHDWGQSSRCRSGRVTSDGNSLMQSEMNAPSRLRPISTSQPARLAQRTCALPRKHLHSHTGGSPSVAVILWPGALRVVTNPRDEPWTF